MKIKMGLIMILMVAILAGGFYLTQDETRSSLTFIGTWIGVIIAMHIVITPIVISIVRARDRKRAELEAQQNQRQHHDASPSRDND
ncbi:hypothetical protein HMPREF9103_01189 [Lentilactobacillus parafarraginis F0439]|uniref:Uncharacterized protein n=1 Tax=Lentilactobacillus parafarraginis F0439 TaxID=797515 RepID=G9ZN86_9LACO|nr:hypothetical protein [Lentilactobacillus parafarraginis]EHL99061.1 hypothetical protein HMPREF9103_01189 [Lentilactobacillus parafarraginis F0439]